MILCDPIGPPRVTLESYGSTVHGVGWGEWRVLGEMIALCKV